jgi:hypothetical protein
VDGPHSPAPPISAPPPRMRYSRWPGASPRSRLVTF